MSHQVRPLVRASRRFAIAALVLGIYAPAHATIIDFDSLSNGAVVTNQFAGQGITFSSDGGQVILITAQPSYQSTPPNFLCTGTAGAGINCTGTVIFDFSAPVSGLEFDAVGNQNTIGTSFAQADIYQNGILTVSNLDLLVSLGHLAPDHQDLSAYSNITRVLIHSNTDPAGTGYDTISFTAGGTSVPEPATLSLLGLGLAGIGFMRRRKVA
jgi:hypothetical protein